MGIRKLYGATLAAMLAAAVAAPVSAQTRVTGTWDANDSNNTRHGEFTCFGAPTCNGAAQVVHTNTQCSNPISFTSDIVMTGVDLSRAGATFSGTYTTSRRYCNTPNADGTCTWTLTAGDTWPYTGTWDGTKGTLNISSAKCNGQPLTRLGTFTATSSTAPSPVFPMTVTGSVSETTANASAQVQLRPQDVGRTESIFVFAHAPSTLLKTDPVTCVLSQLNGQGQLVPVSASSMTPAVTGVISSQGQAVSILNNVPTSNVSGAAFFVGYGTTAADMLGGGVYQSAITIPGQTQCTASIATVPAAASPGSLTGLFWNAAESGWGIHFTQRGANIFAAWYTYDAAGKPKWYVAPNCVGFTGTSGTCNSALYEVTASAFLGTAFDPARVAAVPVGNVQVRFTDAANASFTYTASGITRTVPVVRQPLATGTTPPAVDYTDLWYNPAESGWGMAIAQQFGIAFLAWYVYDSAGKPSWLVATCPMSGSSCSGALYRTTGPGFGPTFDASRVVATAAGTIAVNFTDANNAVLSYTVDGVTATKTITRQIF
jgi:hypothetical protein